jgi:hypothetical protein
MNLTNMQDLKNLNLTISQIQGNVSLASMPD